MGLTQTKDEKKPTSETIQEPIEDKKQKYLFGGFVIGTVAVLQGVAWMVGYNGTVFAFTSLIIGVTAGSILGFTLNSRKK